MTCELLRRRDAGDAPVWDRILRAPHWDLVHAFDTAIEGWLVLVLRRHATSLAELSDYEAAELGPLVVGVSRALERVTGCTKTYVAQFAEHPDHQHVHVHLVPRAADLPADRRGPGIFGMLGVPRSDAVSEERMTALAEQIRQELPPLDPPV